jgi:hypothetical protein
VQHPRIAPGRKRPTAPGQVSKTRGNYTSVTFCRSILISLTSVERKRKRRSSALGPAAHGLLLLEENMKRLSLALFASLLICLPAAPQSAQPAQAPPASDPQAVALVVRAFGVLTGGTAISDITLSGSATRTAGSDSDSGPVTAKALVTGESRMDLTLASGARTEVRATASDGAPAGAWSGPDATPHAMADHNLWTPSTWFFPAFTLQTAASNPGYVVSYLGQEMRGNTSVQHLAISQRVSGTPNTVAFIGQVSRTEVYLDSATMLPVAVTFYVHPDQKSSVDIPVELLFSDYRAVNGAQVAFHVQKYLQNSPVLDLQFQNATFNSGLTSAAFSLR